MLVCKGEGVFHSFYPSLINFIYGIMFLWLQKKNFQNARLWFVCYFFAYASAHIRILPQSSFFVFKNIKGLSFLLGQPLSQKKLDTTEVFYLDNLYNIVLMQYRNFL